MCILEDISNRCLKTVWGHTKKLRMFGFDWVSAAEALLEDFQIVSLNVFGKSWESFKGEVCCGVWIGDEEEDSPKCSLCISVAVIEIGEFEQKYNHVAMTVHKWLWVLRDIMITILILCLVRYKISLNDKVSPVVLNFR